MKKFVSPDTYVEEVDPPTWSRRNSGVMKRVASYEELQGAVGRAIAYRAERYLVRDIVSEPAVVLRLPSGTYPVHDLALRGVSVYLPLEVVDLPLGRKIDLCIDVHDEPVYRGSALVLREERLGMHRRVALQLANGVLDVIEVRRRDADFVLRRGLQRDAQAIHNLVPADYRDVIGRLSHTLAYYRRLVDEHASRYRNLGLAVADLAEELYEQVRLPWAALRDEAADRSAACYASLEALQSGKRYTEELVTQQLMTAPFPARSYLKPLGYPGDFRIMIQLMEDRFEGPDVWSRVLHRLGCNEVLAVGVRTRKDWLKQNICEEFQRWQQQAAPDDVFRVTSLASGPAREVVELIQENVFGDRRVQWTLVDQEERALQLAYHQIHEAITVANVDMKVSCLNAAFSKMLRGQSSGILGSAQNLIYAVGLYDYLRMSTAQRLAAALFESIVPGGSLILGNAIQNPRNFWYTEFVLDWSLIGRTQEQMLQIAGDIADVGSATVSAEPAGAYYYLVLRRRELPR